MSPREIGSSWMGLDYNLVSEFFNEVNPIEHYFYGHNDELLAYLLCMPSFSVHHGRVMEVYYGINPEYRGNRVLAKTIMLKAKAIAFDNNIHFIVRSKHISDNHEVVTTTKI